MVKRAACKWFDCDQPVTPSKGNRPVEWCANPKHNAVAASRLAQKYDGDLSEANIAAKDAGIRAREFAGADAGLRQVAAGIGATLDKHRVWLERQTDAAVTALEVLQNTAHQDAVASQAKTEVALAASAQASAQTKAVAAQKAKAEAEEVAAESQAAASEAASALEVALAETIAAQTALAETKEENTGLQSRVAEVDGVNKTLTGELQEARKLVTEATIRADEAQARADTLEQNQATQQAQMEQMGKTLEAVLANQTKTS
jgi:colicin import membrane protein